MSEDDLVRLQHSRDAIGRAVRIAQGRSRRELDQDELLPLALTRLLEIAGEAAKKISRPVRDRYPQIPWTQLARTRDRLIHGYEDVDLDIVWAIVTHDLPPLVPVLERVISSESQ